MSTISLITDFGTKDWYVGVMKGVIHNIYPSAQTVDITHEIQNHSVEQAAFVLAASHSYFAYGSVHLAVVDPGVGGLRDPILLESRGHYFIGPDNGLFTLVDHPTSTVYVLDKKEYQLGSISGTFHGRDIFAPAAAYLARGVPADQLGSRRKEGIAKIALNKAEKSADGSIRAKIVYVDRFGNCVTNIPNAGLPQLQDRTPVELSVGTQKVESVWSKTYSQGMNAHPIIIPGSSGMLELSLNKADFAQHFRVREGDSITLNFPTNISK